MIRRNTSFVLIITLLIVFGIYAYAELSEKFNKYPVAIYQTLITLNISYYDSDLVSHPKLLNIALESIQDTLEAKGIIINLTPISLQKSNSEALGIFTKQWTDTIFKHETSDHQLEFIAIQAILKSFNDSHTVFYNPKTWTGFKEQFKKKSFGGVGIMIVEIENKVFIVEVLPDGPAELAGILPFDQILAVDDTIIINGEDAVNKIRGPIGKVVTLTVLRKQQSYDITVIRGTIKFPVLTARLFPSNNKRILYIRLYTFSTYDNLSKKLIFEYNFYTPVDGIIIDLRGNAGGLLDRCNELLETFLPPGRDLYITRTATDSSTFTTDQEQFFKQPLIVLINQHSASASEIFSAILQEQKRAIIIGQPSAGSVNVGRMIEIKQYKVAIMITSEQLFTANGTKLEGKGVIPDIEVDRTKDDIIAGRDPQLEKAIEILTE
ncbi:S41 family peptidase [Patescibacteria group bacterium]|nr:S41 family peptidase [Patescibacteria group bacterium]